MELWLKTTKQYNGKLKYADTGLHLSRGFCARNTLMTVLASRSATYCK